MTIAVPVDLADAALTAEIAEDLAVVEAALRDTSFGGDEMFYEVSRHMMQAGGKRFRAMLVLLAARFGDCRDKRLVPAAVAIELTHLATLFHDDVMDEASMRRGRESANSRFGNSIAILAGDYLFARASRMLADLGPQAIRIQAETFGKLVDGQLLETIGVRPGEDPIDHYMHVIAEKTGSLIATSGRFGAMFSGLPDEMADLIAEACLRIGVAWQLSDDVIDIASTSAESGKAQGTDLRQGVRTLPVFYALRSTSTDPESLRLRELLTEGDLSDPALHAEALSLLRSSSAIEEARGTVSAWVAEATDLLAQLPDVPARAAFENLCRFVNTRTALSCLLPGARIPCSSLRRRSPVPRFPARLRAPWGRGLGSLVAQSLVPRSFAPRSAQTGGALRLAGGSFAPQSRGASPSAREGVTPLACGCEGLGVTRNRRPRTVVVDAGQTAEGGTVSIFGFRKTQMVSAEDALPGRSTPMPVPALHEVLHTPLEGPYPEGSEIAEFALGCFWGEERNFWQVPGVFTTAVGYEGGFTPNPTYEEVCTGTTGHAETVRVVYDPAKVSYQQLLKVFWESHDPTQGMRQGNDIGTQYRSAIFYHGEAQKAAAEQSAADFQQRLHERGYGDITTEIVPASDFYFAEDYHQQYLHKVPHGYCPDHSTGVTCPVGLIKAD